MESRVGPSRSFSHVANTVFRTLVIALAVYGALDIARSALAQDAGEVYLPHIASASEFETMSERVAGLEDKLVHVSREGDDLYVTGANVHVVNGEGATDTTNGLGNIIVGYNEVRNRPEATNDRTGSHMLVVGTSNNFSSYGGLVVGHWGWTKAPWSTVSGGFGNTASGWYSAISGGRDNRATGELASIGGGSLNEASGPESAISGGIHNFAHGAHSAVCGGVDNSATGLAASISGGEGNFATAEAAWVGGGAGNHATAPFSSVGGGSERVASGDYDWRAGDLFQDH